MTDPTLDLDAIKARADAATPGPWVAAVGSGPKRRQQQVASLGVASMRGQGEAGCIAVFARVAVGGGRRADDAEFCAAARTDVPALVAEVRRLQGRKPGDPVWSAEFDRLHEVIAELRAQRDAIKQALIFGAYDAVVSSLTLHTVGCTCGECAQLLEALGIELRAQRARGELGVLRAQRDAAPNETQLLREAQQEAHEAAALRAQRNAVLDQPEGN